MQLLAIIILALASAADSRPVSPRIPRAVGWTFGGYDKDDIVWYVPMTDAEYREWYGREITRILDSLRKRK